MLLAYSDEPAEQVQATYKSIVNATGQPAFMIKDFLFQSLVTKALLLHLAFQSKEAGKKEAENNDLIFSDSQENYYLSVPGIQINDRFQVMDKYGVANSRIYDGCALYQWTKPRLCGS